MAERRRLSARAFDKTEVLPVVDAADGPDEPEHADPRAEPAEPTRRQRFARAVADRWPQLSVTIVAGVLVFVSFPPIGWWYAAIAAFALLAWVLTRPGTTLIGGFGYGFLFGLALYLPLLPWTGVLVGPIPWLALSVAEAVFPGLFGLAAVAVRRLPGWSLWFAALWVGQEWLKSTVPFGGFPWGVVGFGQTGGPLLPLAQLGGAPLVTFAVALIGFSITALMLEIVTWWRHGGAAQPTPPAVVLPGVCIAVILLATALIWPQVRQSGVGAGDEPTVTAAAVQGNVPRLGLEFNAQRREVLDNHVAETVRLAEDVRAGRAAQPMFVIWPENSSDIDPLINADAAQQIWTAARAINAPILVGGVLAGPGDSPQTPVATNSVIVWDPVDGPGERHDKQIVQPFGEYLPWRDFFRRLSPYADRAGYFVPGSGTGVVHAAGVPIGIATCWEVIFDRAPREAVLSGAQVLAVPTNNATFNEMMSAQQLAFGKLRAVEHDRYVIVAGTTGISAVIAPDGHELARTEFFQPAYLDTQIRLKTELTPATRWAPVLQGAIAVVGLAALLAAILHNGRFAPRILRRRQTVTGNRARKPAEDSNPKGAS